MYEPSAAVAQSYENDILLPTFLLFFRVAILTTFPSTVYGAPSLHALVSMFVLLFLVILTGVMYYLIVLLTCISLEITGAENFPGSERQVWQDPVQIGIKTLDLRELKSRSYQRLNNVEKR